MMLRFAAHPGPAGAGSSSCPVLTPRLSAYWVNLMTPVPAGIAFPLIEGLKSETICEDDRIRRLVPIEPIGFDEAVPVGRWTKVRQQRRRDPMDQRQPAAPASARGRLSTRPSFPIRDEQRVEVDAPAVALFDRVRRIGGDVGWYYADLLWQIRGWMDRADRRRRPAARAVATRSRSGSATPSTSGGSRTSSPAAGCCSTPR